MRARNETRINLEELRGLLVDAAALRADVRRGA